MIERGSQLKGYIQREIKTTPMHSNYGYTYFFCRNFLERLYNGNPEIFTLKGGYSLFANLKSFIRPLTDMDIVTFGRIEDAKNVIESTIKQEDKVKFEISQRFVTTNSTINYRILCKIDNIQHLITLDLKRDKSFDSNIKELPKIFSQDKSFDVSVATLEELLANKLYLVLLNFQLFEKLGKEFRRLKDFYDIQCILNLGSFDEDRVRDLLISKIKEDEFLSSYTLKGNLFNDEFISANKEKWDDNRNRYEFNGNITFEKSIESVNEFVNKKR